MDVHPTATFGPPIREFVLAGALKRSSLKWRLSLLLTGLFTIVFLLASALYVAEARKDIGRESTAAAHLATALLESVPRVHGVPQVPVQALGDRERLRHLRFTAPDEVVAADRRYPAWFARLFDVAPNAGLPIVVVDQGRAVRNAMLVPVPSDELEEKWNDVVTTAGLALLLLLLLNVSAWTIVRTQLRPLETLRLALDRVGLGQRGVQLDSDGIQELAAVQLGFNRMAAALSEADANNRRLTRELMRVQEEERGMIARELHDEFAQRLTAIDVEAAALLASLPAPADSHAGVASIRNNVRALMRMVRNRLAKLRPEVLDDFGVVAALLELCEQFRSAHPAVQLQVAVPEELQVDDEHAITLFRLVQEALTNVVRHSRASRVFIELAHRRHDGTSMLVLRVQDDGVGLPPSRKHGGFGLLGMRERVEALGGSLRLETGTGLRGLNIEASFPAPAGVTP